MTLLAFFSLAMFGQYQDKLDFTHADVSIAIDWTTKTIHGAVGYTFKVLEKTDSVFLDAKNMEFIEVRLNGKKVRYRNNGKTIALHKKLIAGRLYKLSLVYNTEPKQAVYFVGWGDTIPNNNQIWTQGQGKYTSYWLPSFDNMNEKLEFDMNITFDTSYEIIANGKLINSIVKENTKTWFFDMEKPMSSYLLAFAIGNYDKQTMTSSSGVPLFNYYYPGDSLKVEPTYRYTQQIFDFLETEIGRHYPWQNYKQIPVRDFLYAGMENTGATIFSDAFMIDSVAFMDKNYVNVNAHEMAHQWFGNLVTEVDGNHHWLHEGFATYYAYLAEKEIFGEEHFYWKLYDSAKRLQELSEKEKGEALTNPKAGSLTFYEKGAWALYMLRDQIGEIAFKQGIQKYLQKYQYQNVSINDFINEMEQAGGGDLTDFEKLWLQEAVFPFKKTKKNLRNASGSLRLFFELQRELTTSAQDDEVIILKYWNNSTSFYLRKNIILQYHKSLSEDFLRNAFKTNDLGIRQALAISIEKIPVGLKSEYESLLDDQSYITAERALYQLWVYFPEDRAHYLEKTKKSIGLPNKNVRLLWLLLATLTKDYLENNEKQEYTRELMNYTSPQYPFEVRLNAFTLIGEVFTFTDKNLKDLVNASVHHIWQFRKSARALLDKVIRDDRQKQRLKDLSLELKGEELRYINGKLGME